MLNELTVTYQWLLFIFVVATVSFLFGGRFSIPSFLLGRWFRWFLWSNFCLHLKTDFLYVRLGALFDRFYFMVCFGNRL